jgi:hypothetical protein
MIEKVLYFPPKKLDFVEEKVNELLNEGWTVKSVTAQNIALSNGDYNFVSGGLVFVFQKI